MIDIFSDKASLVLRQMLNSPIRPWVVRDFVRGLGVGRGWAAKVLGQLRRKGYIQGASRGRNASSLLRYPEDLIREWTDYYEFEQNRYFVYYTSDANILPKIKQFFHQTKLQTAYALTLHTGANFMTRHVSLSTVYLYLDPKRFEKLSSGLRKNLDLKELKQGGNIYFIDPYYRSSFFFGLQKIKGYNIVSNLQLYLDLYHFPQRGREHADYLERILKEKGEKIGG